jgi:hypothetical protein
VLASGQRSLEHIDQILARVTSHPPAVDAIGPAVANIARYTRTWVEPTLAVEKFLAMPMSPWSDTLFASPALAYEDEATLGWWRSLRQRVPDDATRARQAAYFEWKRRFVAELHSSGVRLLVDRTLNPGMVPGFALVEELMVLTESGLNRAEVLRAATRGAAEFMRTPMDFGSIQPGARADLVLLAGNPLFDLHVLRRPEGVMVRGRWLDRAALDDLLKKPIP